MYNSGDTITFGNRRFTCVHVIADKKRANDAADAIRKDGFLARVTTRTKRYVRKEPAGSYFAGHGGFEVATYCVWKGAKK